VGTAMQQMKTKKACTVATTVMTNKWYFPLSLPPWSCLGVAPFSHSHIKHSLLSHHAHSCQCNFRRRRWMLRQGGSRRQKKMAP
jgi:hypothetical protein